MQWIRCNPDKSIFVFKYYIYYIFKTTIISIRNKEYNQVSTAHYVYNIFILLSFLLQCYITKLMGEVLFLRCMFISLSLTTVCGEEFLRAVISLAVFFKLFFWPFETSFFLLSFLLKYLKDTHKHNEQFTCVTELWS